MTKCEQCSKPVSQKVAEFSKSKYNKVLCFEHQKSNVKSTAFGLQQTQTKTTSKETNKHIVNLQGKEYILYVGLVKEAHTRGLAEIRTEYLSDISKPESQEFYFKAIVTMESGQVFEGYGDATSKNVKGMVAAHMFRMAECVPLDSQILTIEGWKYYNEVKKGDLVLSYDIESKKSYWTKLKEVNVFENKKLVNIKGRSVDIKCTPDHKWVTTNQRNQQKLVKLNEFNTSHKILLSAKGEEGSLNLTEREAKILGWLFTDGTIGKRCFISQSKVENLPRIRNLVMDDGYEYVGKPTTRTFPTGKTYECLAGHKFYFKPEFSQRLLHKINFTNYEDLPYLAHKLTSESRQNILETMLLADGTKKKDTWVFGKKMKKGVMEFFEMLCTLEGLPLGKQHLSSIGEIPLVTIRKNNNLNSNYFKIKEVKSEKVWCPTTKYGTWIMKQNGCIMITGNTRAKARALRDAIGSEFCSVEEL